MLPIRSSSSRLAALLALTLLAASRAAAGDSGRVAALVRANPLVDANSVERLASALAAMGSALLPELFAELGHALPAEPALDAAADGPKEALSVSFVRDALIGAIDRAPREERERWLDQCLQRGPSPVESRAALLVFERSGRAADFERCLRFAASAALEVDRERTLAAILRRDPRAFVFADVALESAAPELAESLGRALAQSERMEGLRGLIQLAERRPALRQFAFSMIVAAAEHFPRPIESELLASVRRLLADPGAEVLPEAILAAGKLDDDESVPLLIERLADPRAGIRADAAWSLERMSGLHLRERVASWNAWYAEEEEWWRTRAEDCFAQLRDGDPGARTEALAQIGRLHLGRHRVARELANALPLLGDGAACIACQILARLRSTVALEALTDGLSAQDPARRAAAHRALVATTGKNLPSDPSAWRALIEPPPAH